MTILTEMLLLLRVKCWDYTAGEYVCRSIVLPLVVIERNLLQTSTILQRKVLLSTSLSGEDKFSPPSDIDQKN